MKEADVLLYSVSCSVVVVRQCYIGGEYLTVILSPYTHFVVSATFSAARAAIIWLWYRYNYIENLHLALTGEKFCVVFWVNNIVGACEYVPEQIFEQW